MMKIAIPVKQYLYIWFKKIKFHPNFDLRNFCNTENDFAWYYQEIIHRWSKYLSSLLFPPSSTACQFLWLNKDIRIDNKYVIFFNCSKNGIILDSDGKLHCWEFLKETYLWSKNMKFKWLQLIHTLPREW